MSTDRDDEVTPPKDAKTRFEGIGWVASTTTVIGSEDGYVEVMGGGGGENGPTVHVDVGSGDGLTDTHAGFVLSPDRARELAEELRRQADHAEAWVADQYPHAADEDGGD